MISPRRLAAALPCALAASWLVLLASAANAADWPMWRYGAGRGNATPHALPASLHLQWVRELPPADPAWPASQGRLQFDAAPEPVVAGHRIFVPSSMNDNITAYDTRSGAELWRCYGAGPGRCAPL